MQKLSIIIPVHNEKNTIERVLQQVKETDIKDVVKEVIVVDDFSTDGTRDLLPALAEKFSVLVLYHQKNQGKGAGVRTGLQRATGDYVIIQDADLEYQPSDIPNLLSLILNSQNGQVAVFGKRGHKAYPERGFHYVVGAWGLTAFYNLLFRQRLTDLYTCYKLVPTSIFKSLGIRSSGFEFEAEVACKLAKSNIRILEVPISYKPRNKNQGKHLRFRDGFKGLWMIFKCWIK